MKRKLLGLFVASCLVGNVFAQESQETAAAPVAAEDTTASADAGLCHLSVGLKGGINVLKGSTSANSDFLGSDINPAFGGVVEYTFNPLWGLGVEYMYVMNNQINFDAMSHDINLFSSFNLSNIVAKYRSSGLQKLNVYANAGLGVAIYKWEDYTGAARLPKEDDYVRPMVLGGLNFEYNVTDFLAIGLEGQMRCKTRRIVPEGGRFNFGVNLGVRYMFGHENNVRNIALVDYEPKVEVPDLTPLLEEQKRQCAEMTSQLEEQIVNQNIAIRKLQDQVKMTQDSLDSHIRATREPVKYVPTKEEDEIIKTAFSQLEFETNKAIIKQSSYSSLDGLAQLLKSHPEWSVILKGYTDNTGNAAKNLQLSKDRAAAVKNYLIRKGVSAAHIQSFGYGSANPIASNATLAGRAKNRRVEIELFSK